MPKVLSFKKASQTSANINQKAITQFFKTDNSKSIGSQSQNSGIKHENSEATKPNKRKAESPTNCTTREFFTVNSNGTKDFTDAALNNLPKKRKSDQVHLQQSSSSISQQTPKEHNIFSLKSSPRNENYDNGSKHNEDNRIPLSPVNLDNENNKTDKYVSISNLNHVISVKENGSCIKNVVNMTPKKKSPFKSDKKKLSSKKNKSPSSSPKDASSPRMFLRRSPPSTPVKSPHTTPVKSSEPIFDFSPSKGESTVKVLTFKQNYFEDIFDDDWDLGHEEDITEDLDLTTIQRCEVLSIVQDTNRLQLKLKNDNDKQGTCYVEGVWINTPLQEGDIISILATRNSSGQHVVTNTSGLLALRPDHLISSTSVVAGVFCKRKAILQERMRGIDAANTAMTTGILIHELVQAALTRHITSIANLRLEADTIVKQSTQMLYDAGLTIEETKSNIELYIKPLSEFMQVYVRTNSDVVHKQKDKWNGNIDEVLDIEENVCCPKLGLKGKIDATLQVTIHERTGRQRAIVPLELKSGKASISAEHRGQLVLYCMMLSLQRCEDPATSVQRGLLLYLRDRVELHEVSCGYPERRDLMMLRNELVQHLTAGPKDINFEHLVDIEEASSLVQQSLPDPIHHENACTKCPYLTVCSLHLWHTNGPTVSEKHPLSKLRNAALGHLSQEHIKYFLHWSTLLRLEEKEQMMTSPLHALWTENTEKRTKRGTCASNLRLLSVTPSGDRYEHVFQKENYHKTINSRNGPQDGEFSIVSIENRPWIAAGVVTLSDDKEIRIVLERDLSRRLNKDTIYSIDTYESYATTVHNLTNLSVLMEDSDRALRLRSLIVDKEAPRFAPKLHRSIGRLGAKLMRSLNIEQQRAVLRAIAAEDYLLLQGLPGTGKTQTISVLIQMLVGLQKRVLVTAHTHSAVDTVLSRLPEAVRVMRLGSSSRVAASLQARCEDRLAKTCNTPEKLAQLYDSMEVVGVTCLGAAHALLTRTTFDVCIVDEATQVLHCTVLRPLFAAKRFVLVGDPEQLPPVVKSRTARRLGMEESLFHRLMSEEAVSTLRLQYRMNQALVDVANRVAYNGTLKCADQNVAQAKLNLDIKKISKLYSNEPWMLTACNTDPAHAAIFISMPATVAESNNSKNLANIDEACLVMALVEAFKEGGVLSSDIGVIAPYRDQVSFLRRLLSQLAVEVSTVDQFQGRDKSVIIYSCAKRDDGKDDRKLKEGEILHDQRRLAVSVTRAKHKLIVIGSKRALQKYNTWQPLIETCETISVQEDVVRGYLDKYKTLVT